MANKPEVEELELTDSELMTVLKNHGMSRRFMMKLLGAGAAVTALGGTAAANPGKGKGKGEGKGDNGKGNGGNGNDEEDEEDDEEEGSGERDARIDEVFGAPYSINESPPKGLPDHEVHLHAHGDEDPSDGLGALEDFPQVPDSPEDEDEEPEEFHTEFFFDPVGLHVETGDVVNFAIHSHEHTVTSFHRKYLPLPPNEELPPPLRGTVTRVPDGAFTSPPIVGDESWLYRFETEGVYDLLCLPHIGFGMVMRIVVSDSDDVSGFDDYGDLPLSATVEQPLWNANLVLTDEVLNPQNIVDEGSIAWADLTPHTS